MKKYGKSSKMYVMLGLLAVLFLSLGVLSMQGTREGLVNKKVKEQMKELQDSLAKMPNGSTIEKLMKLDADKLKNKIWKLLFENLILKKIDYYLEK